MISSISHRELFVFYCRIDTRVVPGPKERMSHVWWQRRTRCDTFNQWLFVIGDWHNASSMAPPHNVIAYFPNLFATELLFCDIFGLSEGCFRWIHPSTLNEVFVAMSRRVKHAALPQIPFLSLSIFVCWDTCDGWKWGLCVLCLSSLVSRVSWHLAVRLVGVTEEEQTRSNWCAGSRGEKRIKKIKRIKTIKRWAGKAKQSKAERQQQFHVHSFCIEHKWITIYPYMDFWKQILKTKKY